MLRLCTFAQARAVRCTLCAHCCLPLSLKVHAAWCACVCGWQCAHQPEDTKVVGLKAMTSLMGVTQVSSKPVRFISLPVAQMHGVGTDARHGTDAGRTSMTARNASSAISSVGTKDAPTPALFTRHVIGCPAATATSATTLLQSPAEFTSNWQGREGKWGRGDPMIRLATSTIHSRCRILVSATSRPQCRSKRWCLASHRCEK